MRHFDIDPLQRLPSWPDIGRGAVGDGRPEPVGAALGKALLGGGRVMEAAVVAAAGVWAADLAGSPAPRPLAVAAVALLVANLLSASGLYAGERGYGAPRAVGTAAAVTLAGVVVAALAAAWLDGGTADGVADWAVLATAGVAALRLLWGAAIDRLGRWTRAARRVLVVGDRERALDVLALLAGSRCRWAFPVGVCLDRDPPERPAMGGFITGLADAEATVRREGVHDVVVAVPWGDGARMAACLAALRPLAVDVHLFPDDPVPYADGTGMSLLSGVPMARVAIRPLAGVRAVAKAVEDRVLAGLLVVALAPLMLAVAAAIKLDSRGPVLFRQQRYGYDNQPFTCLKFRSMAAAAAPEGEVRQATRDDPRVTRVGRILRRTSLDELPQLFNVLGGSMSLVGPRPHATSHHHYYARLVDDYRCRHRMKPGLTGWAQVNGFRGETTTVDMMRKRVLHDLWYIDHWSPWLDLRILARTPGACLKGTNAY